MGMGGMVWVTRAVVSKNPGETQHRLESLI